MRRQFNQRRYDTIIKKIAAGGIIAEIKTIYDVVIISSGVGGGTTANQLADQGAKVLIIERGERLPREADT